MIFINIYIFPNLDKTKCQNYVKNTCKLLKKENADIYMDSIYSKHFDEIDYIRYGNHIDCINKCDIVIVIGGDGTILKCAVEASKANKPILGINCGRLGFMASLEHDDLEKLKYLFSNNYTVSSRMMLNIDIIEENKKIQSFTSLNDVVISKSDDCKIADFCVSKGRQIISNLRADGVIFSTATGSTAYSMSAGGPIVEPGMECIEFTQICPHSLFARSMILSPQSIVNVKFHCNNKSHAIVNVDGNVVQKISDQSFVRISQSPFKLNIIDISGESFFNSINEKLMKPLKEKGI